MTSTKYLQIILKSFITTNADGRPALPTMCAFDCKTGQMADAARYVIHNQPLPQHLILFPAGDRTLIALRKEVYERYKRGDGDIDDKSEEVKLLCRHSAQRQVMLLLHGWRCNKEEGCTFPDCKDLKRVVDESLLHYDVKMGACIPRCRSCKITEVIFRCCPTDPRWPSKLSGAALAAAALAPVWAAALAPAATSAADAATSAAAAATSAAAAATSAAPAATSATSAAPAAASPTVSASPVSLVDLAPDNLFPPAMEAANAMISLGTGAASRKRPLPPDADVS